VVLLELKKNAAGTTDPNRRLRMQVCLKGDVEYQWERAVHLHEGDTFSSTPARHRLKNVGIPKSSFSLLSFLVDAASLVHEIYQVITAITAFPYYKYLTLV